MLALLFVTLPFVVRTVQPVLLELDREMEEAARSLGASRAADLPAGRPPEHPARDPLRGRARVREGGRRVRLARDHHRQPARTRREVSSVFIFGRIESGDQAGRGRGRRRPARDLVRASCSRSARSATTRRGTTVARRTRSAACVALAYLAAMLSGRSRSSSGAPSRTASAPPGTRSRRPRRCTRSS